jgi:hypothetical protein
MVTAVIDSPRRSPRTRIDLLYGGGQQIDGEPADVALRVCAMLAVREHFHDRFRDEKCDG